MLKTGDGLIIDACGDTYMERLVAEKIAQKTQPQRLLEEVIGAEGQRADFPSIEAQQAYWDALDAEYEVYLNEQHLWAQKDTKRDIRYPTAQEGAS